MANLNTTVAKIEAGRTTSTPVVANDTMAKVLLGGEAHRHGRIEIGTQVERIGSGKGTDGSKGEVKEVSDKGWAKVFWHTPAHSGTKAKHTKVAFKFLKVVSSPLPEGALGFPAAAPAKKKTAAAKKTAPAAAAPAAKKNPNDPTPKQLEVLKVLAKAKKGYLSRNEIGEAVNVSSGFCSLLGHADTKKTEPGSLQGKGLIKAEVREDVRGVVYVLTAAGKKAAGK